LSLEMAWELGWRLFGRWEAAVQRKGARVLAEYGLDVRLCNLDDMSSGALGDYLTKVGYEAAGEHFKTGRVAESFTMLSLVQEVADSYEEQAFIAWRELEATLAGNARRFVDFSKGARELRKRAGHRELSEQEMADEDHHGDDVLAIDREAWPTVAAELEQLLSVAESEGLGAAKVWLTVRGVGWRDMTPAPRLERPQRPSQRPPRPSRPPGRRDRALAGAASRRVGGADRQRDRSAAGTSCVLPPLHQVPPRRSGGEVRRRPDAPEVGNYLPSRQLLA
jgi:hypothetical protein